MGIGIGTGIARPLHSEPLHSKDRRNFTSFVWTSDTAQTLFVRSFALSLSPFLFFLPFFFGFLVNHWVFSSFTKSPERGFEFSGLRAFGFWFFGFGLGLGLGLGRTKELLEWVDPDGGGQIIGATGASRMGSLYPALTLRTQGIAYIIFVYLWANEQFVLLMFFISLMAILHM